MSGGLPGIPWDTFGAPHLYLVRKDQLRSCFDAGVESGRKIEIQKQAIEPLKGYDPARVDDAGWPLRDAPESALIGHQFAHDPPRSGDRCAFCGGFGMYRAKGEPCRPSAVGTERP